MNKTRLVAWGFASLAAVALTSFCFGCGENPAKAERTENSVPTDTPGATFDSPLAGSWYDGDPAALRAEIAGFLSQADEKILPNVQALILPHAGYRYSGPTAAYGIKQISGRSFSRVVILGPSHRVPLRNFASLPGYDRLRTPLGEVPVDKAFIAALKEEPMFKVVPVVDQVEHSVQIEVPLLQQALGEFKLVPIVVGQLDRQTVDAMAQVLLGLIDEKTLVVGSSDFTHYGANYGYTPFTMDFAENLKKLDMAAFDAIKNKDVAAFEAHIRNTGDTICGHYPIEVLLSMLPKNSEAHLLHYETSGQNLGDFTNSVSYLSIAFTGTWPKAKAIDTAASKAVLGADDERLLLKLARETLSYYLAHHALPDPTALGIEITPAMKKVMGGFVTLEEGGALRGCIGEIKPRRPLYRVVMDHAVDAAVNDPRFRPVTADELPKLHIEISALTPPHPVSSYKDIVIGKDGVTLEKGGRFAVFLPQVAPEQGWGVEETLTHLAMKAGLPPDAWKSGASFQVFEAVVFGEEGA